MAVAREKMAGVVFRLAVAENEENGRGVIFEFRKGLVGLAGMKKRVFGLLNESLIVFHDFSIQHMAYGLWRMVYSSWFIVNG